jgi:hypothetical protein
MYDYIGSKLEFIDGDGNLDAEDVDALVPLLAAATATPNECHYAPWQGWGWVHPGSMASARRLTTPLRLAQLRTSSTRRWHRSGTLPQRARSNHGGPAG